jgi:DivIVA domain-containing protein
VANEQGQTEELETQKLQTPPRGELRTRIPDAEIEDLRHARFGLTFPGYNRKQVDAHLTRVNRILAELQITAAPESAIRHALAQVSEETRSLIEGAQHTAEEITSRAKSEADERLARATQQAEEQQDASEDEARRMREAAATEAKQVRETAARETRELREAAQREANEMREAAETRVRELEADAQAIAGERRRLIEGLRELTRGLDDYLSAVEQRFTDVEPAPPLPEEPQEELGSRPTA